MNGPRGIAILGSSGSIGRSTLAVVALHPDRFRVVMIGAFRSWETIVEQARRFEPEVAVLVDPEAAALAAVDFGADSGFYHHRGKGVRRNNVSL